jgi:hypothetical protein
MSLHRGILKLDRIFVEKDSYFAQVEPIFLSIRAKFDTKGAYVCEVFILMNLDHKQKLKVVERHR